MKIRLKNIDPAYFNPGNIVDNLRHIYVSREIALEYYSKTLEMTINSSMVSKMVGFLKRSYEDRSK